MHVNLRQVLFFFFFWKKTLNRSAPPSTSPEMDLKIVGRMVLFPVQMLYYLIKASLFALLPSRRKDLTKEVVLVTGGGRGIGRHLAKEFAKQGAKKVISFYSF